MDKIEIRMMETKPIPDRIKEAKKMSEEFQQYDWSLLENMKS